MDIITYSADLEKQMRQQLEELNQASGSTPDPVSLTARRLSVISGIIEELREFVYGYKFKSGEEEIKFFKEIKPVFSSQYLFQKEVYSISLADSFMNRKEKLKYYNSFLKKLLEQAKRQRDFYLYCMAGDRSRDEVYFKRVKKLTNPMKDRLFTTDRDGDLAVILSHTLVKEYLQAQISRLKGRSESASGLTWTGSKTDLVELLLALHASGVLNNSSVKLSVLIETFANVLNVELGSHFDYIKNIRGRKKSRAVFLEKLQSQLLARLDALED